jgi:molecular chaperone GrpE
MKRESIPIDEGTEQKEARAEGDSSSTDADALQKRIAELEAENQQLRDKALRAVAEVENVRRRSESERLQVVEYANEQLLRQILPIIDDFQRSVEAGATAKDFDTLYRGVEMVHANLQKTLDRIGVRRMETVGKPFDVNLHEAIMRQPSDAPEDTIVTDVEAGYTYHDKVLRHAKVIISAGS